MLATRLWHTDENKYQLADQGSSEPINFALLQLKINHGYLIITPTEQD